MDIAIKYAWLIIDQFNKKLIILCVIVTGVVSAQSQSQSDYYYPLQLGNEWNYISRENRSSKEKITDTLRINNKLYFGSACSNIPYACYYFRNSGSEVYTLDLSDSSEYKLFDFDAEVGESWDLAGFACSFGIQIKLESINDTVITSIDTFKNCYHFKHTAYCMDAGYQDSWFAPNIGKVRFKQVTLGGIQDNKLLDYNLLTENKQFFKEQHIGKLFQNYPNPFYHQTKITYYIATPSKSSIKIYNIFGEEIFVKHENNLSSGYYNFIFKPKDIPAGSYFYQLQVSGNLVSTKKLIYVK